MEEQKVETSKEFWKRKIKEHKIVFMIAIIGGVLAFIGVFLVLFWLIETSPVGKQGEAALGEWSLAWIWLFGIALILWELLFIGVPAGLVYGLGGYLWWKRLSAEERAEFKREEAKEEAKSSHKKASGGFGFLMFIAYSIYIAFDGNFFTAFDTYPYTYWVYSWIFTFFWILLLAGIPALIYLVYWCFKDE